MRLLGRQRGKKQYDDELAKIEQQIQSARKKQAALILKRAEADGVPASWTPDVGEVLVEVTATESEYWDVAEHLQSSMSDAYVTNLWRVQNSSLWAHYSYRKEQLERNGRPVNESKVFLGTSGTDPRILYNGEVDGSMMQSISRNGAWGRGVYFAEQSAYSDAHDVYLPTDTCMHFAGQGDRPYPNSGERELFLGKLLVGSAAHLNRDEGLSMKQQCLALTAPPLDPVTGEEFDTVIGRTNGTQIYIVYEDGRAYPEYLIRYYRGKRDPNRTPFGSRIEATKVASTPATSLSSDISDTFLLRAPDVPTWEFLDNSGWSAYGATHQREIEDFYQAYRNNPRLYRPTLIIQTQVWQYEIDVARMKQRNMQHFDHRERDIQRVVGPSSI